MTARPREPHDIGKAAWAFLIRTRCLPTSEAYRIAYSYARADSPDLLVAVSTAISKDERLGPAAVDRIHREHFLDPLTAAVEEAAEAVEDAVQSFSGIVQSAGTTGKGVAAILKDACGALTAATPKDLASRITQCRDRARALQSAWPVISRKLDGSLQQIEDIRDQVRMYAETVKSDALTDLLNARGLLERVS